MNKTIHISAEDYRNGNFSLAPKQPKRHKYNAQKTEVDGIYFDSKAEAEFYAGLKLLLRAKEIKGFARQARFVIGEGTEYVTDFIIINNDNTCRIVDVKGIETSDFKLKMKMMKEKYPELVVELEK